MEICLSSGEFQILLGNFAALYAKIGKNRVFRCLEEPPDSQTEEKKQKFFHPFQVSQGMTDVGLHRPLGNIELLRYLLIFHMLETAFIEDFTTSRWQLFQMVDDFFLQFAEP